MSHHSHPYHLVNPSPWPFVGAMSTLLFTFGMTRYMHVFHLA
jgi:cytochrome c oxidase subunit 3